MQQRRASQKGWRQVKVMAITLRVFKDAAATNEVSYNGAMTNPAYFGVAVVPVSGNEYAPDEDGLTLYVKVESTGERAIDLKVRAEPLSAGNPPDAVLDGFEAFEPSLPDLSAGEWKPCSSKFVTVSVPGSVINPNTVLPVKLRVRSDAGDPVGQWRALLHFVVYNIGS